MRYRGSSAWPLVAIILGTLSIIAYMVVSGHPEAMFILLFLALVLLA